MPSRSGAVHVAINKRRYKGRTYTSYLLRRSVRVGQQVKHETLGNLSHLPAPLIDIIRRRSNMKLSAISPTCPLP